MLNFPLPVLGFSAFSGSGKTTLLKKLLPILVQKGVRCAVVKHAHHAFEVDQPGKDSFELRKAGAAPMLVASSQRMAMMLDFPVSDESPAKDPDLQEMIDFLPLHRLDCVLVEGFKAIPFPKIEIHRPATGKPVIAVDDTNIIAIATNDVTKLKENLVDSGEAVNALPLLDLNDPEAIADFVIQQVEQQRQALDAESCIDGDTTSKQGAL
ncbi:molybdopterin-guanine dinucleotide biosynthesis protein B [Oceanospirillum sanctuarii]|uniref:molybdopterin-guanine dinucleotide biosynthesis protein B n=1 Tax=Oceanospirillum sanctuarii TaxID=1434821 RepID=UPI000A3A6537|nr:molybdopterin-guanine dinucleotide biosynthesis protein B [Oceanospirillum sanctuarii]